MPLNCPKNGERVNFLVLDFDPRSGLSFFREGRQRFRAEGEGKYFAAKKESFIPQIPGCMESGDHLPVDLDPPIPELGIGPSIPVFRMTPGNLQQGFPQP